MNEVVSYEAVYEDSPPPGRYLVVEIPKNNGETQEQDVIEVENLEVIEGVLICNYKILKDSLPDEQAIELIMKSLLNEFCDNYYYDKARQVKFKNTETNFSETILHSL